MKDWLSKNSLKIITYVLILAGLILIFLTTVKHNLIFSGDKDSGRYLLSALIQSMATISVFAFTIPLIITQSLVNKYGESVYNFYFNKKTIGLFVFIVVMILYQVLALSWISGNANVPLSENLVFLINVGIILSGMTFPLILLFIFEIKENLKPEKLVFKIKNDMIESINTGELKKAEEHFYQLRNMTNAAINYDDFSTVAVCIKTWIDLRCYEKPSYIQTMLANFFSQILSMASDKNETLVKGAIIDELNKEIWRAIDRADHARASMCLNLLVVQGIGGVLEKHPELGHYTASTLRSTAQIKMIDRKDSIEIVVEIIDAIGQLVYSAAEAGNIRILEYFWHEIINIIAQGKSSSIPEDNQLIIFQKGFNIISTFCDFPFTSEKNKLVKSEVNNICQTTYREILSQFSYPSDWKDIHNKTKLDILPRLIQKIVLYGPEDCQDVIFIGTMALKDEDRDIQKLAEEITKWMKGRIFIGKDKKKAEKARINFFKHSFKYAKKRRDTFNFELPIEEFEDYFFRD